LAFKALTDVGEGFMHARPATQLFSSAEGAAPGMTVTQQLYYHNLLNSFI